MFRVTYNNDFIVKANYPDFIQYNNIIIDEINLTIDDGFEILPYIEITNQQHSENLGKTMAVVDGVYQEYEIPQVELLAQAKRNKINVLDNYHYNSVDIRTLTINSTFLISLTKDGRDFVAEQINQLEQKIRLGLILEENAFFEYFYGNSSVNISLLQLRQIYIEMINVVNSNFGIYQQEILAVNSLTTVESVDAYDFTTNYLKNNNINIT